MKYLPIFLFLLLCGFVVLGFKQNHKHMEYDYLRVHIRANSNSEIDQEIKYIIKDEVVTFITPYLIECDTKQKSIDVINSLLNDIENVCDDVLIENGFCYKSTAKIDKEKFPTRSYENVTLEEGIYDALIIELGSGKGDNWWCIVYPPLCFVNKSDLNEHNIQYQSYLLEIIDKYFS